MIEFCYICPLFVCKFPALFMQMKHEGRLSLFQMGMSQLRSSCEGNSPQLASRRGPQLR